MMQEAIQAFTILLSCIDGIVALEDPVKPGYNRIPNYAKHLTTYLKEKLKRTTTTMPPIAATFTEHAIFVTTQGPFYGRESIEKYYADRIQKGHFSNFVIKYYPDSIRALGTAGNEMWAAGEWSITIQGQNGPMPFHGYWGAVKARGGDTWKTRLDVSNTA